MLVGGGSIMKKIQVVALFERGRRSSVRCSLQPRIFRTYNQAFQHGANATRHDEKSDCVIKLCSKAFKDCMQHNTTWSLNTVQQKLVLCKQWLLKSAVNCKAVPTRIFFFKC